MSSNPGRLPCRGPSRRDVLRIGSLGFLGLGLDDWFRIRATAAGSSGGPSKVRNCILIWLAGGPSHIDTFDPKPDAAVDVRGEFKPIDTSVPGLKISEVFPNLAKVMNQVTLIRSMTSPEADHDRAAHHMLTSYRPSPALVYPGYGSVVAKSRESTRGMLPPYVAVPDAPIFASSGYLTPAYDPFAVSGDPNHPGFRVQNLTPPDKVTLERLMRRRDMVKKLDDFAHDVSSTPLTASRDQFAERAYALLTSSAAQRAFKMSEESDAVRDKFGRTTFGQSCLLARRLIEAGVSFVTINDRGMGPLGWDTHVQNFPTIKNTLGPPLDKGVVRTPGRLDRTRPAREYAGRDARRVRPHPQDQQECRPRSSRPRQLRAPLRRGHPWRPGHRPYRRRRRCAGRAPGHSARPGDGAVPQAGDRSGHQVRSSRRPANPSRRRRQPASGVGLKPSASPKTGGDASATATMVECFRPLAKGGFGGVDQRSSNHLVVSRGLDARPVERMAAIKQPPRSGRPVSRARRQAHAAVDVNIRTAFSVVP